MELKSKCCNAKIVYIKEPNNKHDECSKCGIDPEWLEEKLRGNPDFLKK